MNKITDLRISLDKYSAAVQEARDTFANVYKEEITPYTELSWGISRLIGEEPAKHIPASRWHNALCMVRSDEVMDLDKWSKAILYLHFEQMKSAMRTTLGRTYSYADNYVSRAQMDIDSNTRDFIDREIKRAYPKVRRNTKRYRELYDKVKDKARKLTAAMIADRAQHELDALNGIIRDRQKDADKMRETAYELERASFYVLTLNPDSAEVIGTETRAMLDTLLARAAALVRPWIDAQETIQDYIVSMRKLSAESEIL